MNKTIPYTYLIGWPALNMWYYGVRYARDCNPVELWQTYFTSSSHVAKFVEEHGNPTHIEIRKIFTEVSIAQLWEHRVLKRMNVITRTDFLNKTDNKSIAPQYGNNNPATRPEVKAKISATVTKVAKRGDDHPRRTNPEKYAHLSELFKGRRNYWQEGDLNPAKRPEVRAKLKGMQNSKGYKHTEEHKQSVSKRFKGVLKPRCSCLYCHEEIATNLLTRWHGDNCVNR